MLAPVPRRVKRAALPRSRSDRVAAARSLTCEVMAAPQRRGYLWRMPIIHVNDRTAQNQIGRGEAGAREPRARRRRVIVALAAFSAIFAAIASSPLQAQPAQPPGKAPAARNVAPAARSPASNANELVVSYLAAWNERDAGRRRALVAKTWTDRGEYTDAHRHGEGHDGIDAMIKTAQDRFPGYQLRLVSGIEAHNGYLRFSWAAGGTPEAPLYLGGTDFATVAADGKLQAVAGFVDAAPVPAAH